ncbi:MAG: hypothetical protein ABI867_13300 [Kofleriaceae bacterium]
MHCEHADRTGRACSHLLEREQAHFRRFTGRGIELELVCEACRESRDLVDVCAACQARAADGGWSGVVGAPEIREQPSGLRFDHARIDLAPAMLDLQPVLGADRALWIGLAGDGRLWRWDMDRGVLDALAHVPPAIDLAQPVTLRISRDARLAAVANTRAQHGAVIDLETGAPTLTLVREDAHEEHCDFSLAFVEHAGRTLLVHAPEWNRLDLVDARTGEVISTRESPRYERDTPRPDHYLDYFHCGLTVSPDQRWIADNGWVWHPVGVLSTWSIEAWLANVWESEDGPTRRDLCHRGYYWDGPVCWLDATRLAVFGYGEDDPLMPAARIFDVTTGDELRWFPGPDGDFVFDRVLVAMHREHGATVWDVESGARLARDEARLRYYHPGAKVFVSAATGGSVTASRLRGHAAQAAWNRGAVRDLARTIAAERTFDELPILGDALEVAGCTDEELLAHCRAPGAHGDRCWLLDRLDCDP